MKKRYDYRNSIKQLNKESLITFINNKKDRLLSFIGYSDDECAKLLKEISYAQQRLTKLNN